MKHITILLMALLLVSSACKKDDNDDDANKLAPTASVKGFAIEWTSVTCSICGATGGPLLKKYSQDAPHGAMIALHVNSTDSMKIPNSVYFAFKEDRPSGGGIPSFWVGDTKTSTSDQAAVIDQVSGPDAVGGIDFNYEISGNTMTIETLTKFFSNGVGEYYLSILVLEDGIDGSANASQGYKQAGGATDYKHNFVYRTEATATMGELIATNPTADKEISKTYTVTVDSKWVDPYPVAILWKHDANGTIKYTYVNSFRK